MLDAIFYVTDNGIKWRSMPADFPAWDRVYACFRRWREPGLAREFHDRLRGQVRLSEGRAMEPSAAIIDSQSVKAAASVPRGYDGGKKINQASRVRGGGRGSGRAASRTSCRHRRPQAASAE
ncbi:transposase [Streptomyces sp. NPDC048566]|uniref:transposase n=1 Tax=Streptomyces sp. NPDC048566 TaxID=3365569 RepID=UPI003717F4EF